MITTKHQLLFKRSTIHYWTNLTRKSKMSRPLIAFLISIAIRILLKTTFTRNLYFIYFTYLWSFKVIKTSVNVNDANIAASTSSFPIHYENVECRNNNKIILYKLLVVYPGFASLLLLHLLTVKCEKLCLTLLEGKK